MEKYFLGFVFLTRKCESNLKTFQDDSYHWCGATIVTRFKLITAAHCLKDFPIGIYRVRVGDYSLSKLAGMMGY